MTLRSTPEVDAALELLARTNGVSKQEAAKRAIIAQAEEVAHRGDVEQATDAMLARWGRVLDRLGNA